MKDKPIELPGMECHWKYTVDEIKIMNLKIEVKRNADGSTSMSVLPNCGLSLYWWQEGCGACDCNREEFFMEGRNECPMGHRSACSDGRYSVRISDADTGAVLYSEFLT